MVREHGFRVWCKNNNEWEKDICLMDQNGVVFHRTNHACKLVDQETHIAQFFIGLNDIKGKKIYEGDIVRYTGRGLDFIGIIIFHPGTASYCVRSINKAAGHARMTFSNICIEILGNIFENPKLLGGDTMSSLDNFSTDELKQEIIKRGMLSKTNKPQVLSVEVMLLQLPQVIQQCRNYIDSIDENGNCDTSDTRNSIFESCVEMVFGASVWDWINDNMQ